MKQRNAQSLCATISASGRVVRRDPRECSIVRHLCNALLLHAWPLQVNSMWRQASTIHDSRGCRSWTIDGIACMGDVVRNFRNFRTLSVNDSAHKFD
jgi:hypothetical protein